VKYHAALDSLGLPVHHCADNHEVIVEDGDAFQRFKREFGPAWYAFNFGGVHFIVLRDVDHFAGADGAFDWIGVISEDEMAWLRNHLPHVPNGRPIIVTVHMPFASTWDLRWPQPEHLRYATTIKGADEALELFDRYAVRLVLAGHTHDNEHTKIGSTDHVLTAAACGSWWNGPNIDDAPNGYRIVRVRGSGITTTYKCVGHPESYQFVVDAVCRTPSGDVQIGVNVFDGRAQTHVSASAIGANSDEVPLQRMSPETACESFRRKSQHYWMGTIHRQAVAGASRIQVRVADDRWNEFYATVDVPPQGSRLPPEPLENG